MLDKASVQRIEPRGKRVPFNLKELWDHIELIYFLTWRELTARYRQTLVGFGWAVIQPFLTMVIFTIVFGGLAEMPSNGIPYPLFCYAALAPWMFFANALINASGSVVGHGDIITSVYFPRLVLPLTPILAGLVDLVASMSILAAMMVIYDYPILPRIVLLPAFALLAALSALAAGIFLGTLNVKYRDVGYLVPFLTQIWLFLTPIAYPSSLMDEPWRTISGLNPMAGVVEGFRWVLIDAAPAPGPMLWVSVGAVIAMLIGSVYYFRQMESTFTDIV